MRRESVEKVDTAPAAYFPFERGEYRVEAGLRPMGADFGNGSMDGRVFQIDGGYGRFLENVAGVRAENLDKYYVREPVDAEFLAPVIEGVARQLCMEYPELFGMDVAGDRVTLDCALTGDRLVFDELWTLVDSGGVAYRDALDALASQVPEDIAVLRVDESGDRLVAAHIAGPSRWDPRDKIGKSFVEVHGPVAEIERLNEAAPALLRGMMRGPAVQRFGWSVTTDDRLNHHPEMPAGFEGSQDAWYGKCFDAGDPRLFVRIERQVLKPFADVGALLFTIRLYFVDCRMLERGKRLKLRDALMSMTAASRRYKELDGSFAEMVTWLERD